MVDLVALAGHAGILGAFAGVQEVYGVRVALEGAGVAEGVLLAVLVLTADWEVGHVTQAPVLDSDPSRHGNQQKVGLPEMRGDVGEWKPCW